MTDLWRALLRGGVQDTFRDGCLKALDQKDGFLMSSGREAFYLILASLLKRGDEIIIPSFSCNVLLDAIVKTGVVPVFADVSSTSLNMEAEQLEACISPRTRAVVMTHQFGYPAAVEKIQDLCRKHSLLLIEDAAPAFGAQYRGTPVGKFGDVAFFSFERSKVISTFNGGLLVGKKNYLDRIRAQFPQRIEFSSMSHFARAAAIQVLQSRFVYAATYAAWKLRNGANSTAGNWTPDISEYGESYSGLSNFQAALGITELSRLDSILKERMRAAAQFREAISQSQADVLVPQLPEDGRESTYSRFALLVPNKDAFHAAAHSLGLDLGYTFSYKLSQYRNEWDCSVPNTDFIVKHIVNIPISRNASTNDRISRCLTRVLLEKRNHAFTGGIMLPSIKSH